MKYLIALHAHSNELSFNSFDELISDFEIIEISCNRFKLFRNGEIIEKVKVIPDTGFISLNNKRDSYHIERFWNPESLASIIEQLQNVYDCIESEPLKYSVFMIDDKVQLGEKLYTTD